MSNQQSALPIIPLWPDGAPGSATWTQRETESPTAFDARVIRNVTRQPIWPFALADGTQAIRLVRQPANE